MSYEILTGLLATGLGVLLTLAFQSYRKAQKAVKEADEAVESVNNLAMACKGSFQEFEERSESLQKAHQADIDKRIQKLEIRLEDLSNRFAAQQIKR